MNTCKELMEIAKQKKVKHYKRYKKHELEKILELEKTDPTEFYEKYCKGKWIVRSVVAINNSKGEEISFTSLYAAAKYFNTWPQTIKQKI